MKTATSKTARIAAEFVNAATAAGWKVSVRGNVVSIFKGFDCGSREQFVALDGEYYGILSMVPARGGSMWGTDGSGVGGYSAMLHGLFTMNVSGVSERMAAAIVDACEAA